MEQNKIIKKSWRKIAKERIAQEMFYGRNYVKDQSDRENRKRDLRWYGRMVKDWTMSDAESILSLNNYNTPPYQITMTKFEK